MSDDYVISKIDRFQKYINKEINILEDKGVVYAIGYDFLDTLVLRARLYIKHNAPAVPLEDFPDEHNARKFQEQRARYLEQVASILTDCAKRYAPPDGSFWENARNRLHELSRFANDLQWQETKTSPESIRH